MAKLKDKPIVNPSIVLREEFDDWAILFDPDTGGAFGLNPVGVFMWKLLDGSHTIEDLLKKLQTDCKNIPDGAGKDVKEFIQSLVERGFAGYEVRKK